MADDCVSKVELSIQARGLRDMDFIGKSDPFAILYTKLADAAPGNLVSKPSAVGKEGRRYNQNTLDQGWVEYGRTETIQNDLNPNFAKSFEMPYFFERNQYLRIELYDRDAQSDTRLMRHDYLGGAEMRLADVIASRGQLATANLVDAKMREKGQVTLLAEEARGLKRAISLDLLLRQKKWSLMKNVFMTISRAREGGTWTLVYKSPVTKKVTKGAFDFKSFKISSQKLNNGDPGRPLKFEFFVHAPNGSHKPYGEVTSTETELLKRVSTSPDEAGRKLLISNKKQTVAELEVVRAVSKPVPTFLDYIFGGCEINLLLAIDFTASNGDPRRVGTLHHNDPNGPNEYEAAMRAVGNVLVSYDTDQLIPAYGYGARLPPDNVVSHCFALNGNPSQPDCRGIEEVMEAYRMALQSVSLSGPTVFSQIMSLASDQANQSVTQEKQSYTILLIITDGIISDVDATVHEIVRASDLPLSIVIVGVGNSNFKEMDMLDADDEPLVSGGEVMKRDIVQFVPFRAYRSAPAQLADEVLKEIPDQILSYMSSHKIKPNPPRAAVPATATGAENDLLRHVSSLNREGMLGTPSGAPSTAEFAATDGVPGASSSARPPVAGPYDHFLTTSAQNHERNELANSPSSYPSTISSGEPVPPSVNSENTGMAQQDPTGLPASAFEPGVYPPGPLQNGPPPPRYPVFPTS